MKNLIKKILAFLHIPTDKFLHFCACCGATIVVSACTFFLGKTSSIFCGGLFALGLGLGKEYGDSKSPGNKWDWWDIVADLIGIACGIGIILVIYLIVGR